MAIMAIVAIVIVAIKVTGNTFWYESPDTGVGIWTTHSILTVFFDHVGLSARWYFSGLAPQIEGSMGLIIAQYRQQIHTS